MTTPMIVRVLVLLAWMTCLSGSFALAGVEFAEPTEDGRRDTLFTFKPPAGTTTVAVAGTFNRWDPFASPLMDDDGDGTFERHESFACGTVAEYKFVANGDQWTTDPDNPETTDSVFGGNSMLKVPACEGAAVLSGDVCQVTIEYLSSTAKETWLLWGLDGWQPPIDSLWPGHSEAMGTAVHTPMAPVGGGRFRATVHVPQGSTLDYVFHIVRPEEAWDNNGGQGVDYHAKIDGPTRIENRSAGFTGDADAKPQGAGLLRWLPFVILLIGMVVAAAVLFAARGGDAGGEGRTPA